MPSLLLRFAWLRMLLRPTQAINELLHSTAPKISVLPSLLGGILLVQWWADLANLGGRFAEGQILAASLIAGPPLGLLLAILSASSVLLFGRLLVHADRAVGFAQRLRNGGPSWGRLIVIGFRIGGLWPVLGLVMLIELVLGDARQFFPNEGSNLVLILKTLLVLGYFCLQAVAIRCAFPQLGTRWILAALAAICGTCLILVAAAFLLGLPLI
jgi:hypothetical protein